MLLGELDILIIYHFGEFVQSLPFLATFTSYN